MPDRPDGRSPKRAGRGRPASGAHGVVRVDPDFADEYPDGDATCTEAYATLCRTGAALLAELERRVEVSLGISQTASTALAVLDGAGEPLTPSQISERVLISTGTMTSTLDGLERRGLVRRTPNPEDRRSLLIEITEAGRDAADEMLPGIRKLERTVLSSLTATQRRELLDLLAKVLARAAEVAAEPAEVLSGTRIRPARLR